jgi:hypothetical protein
LDRKLSKKAMHAHYSYNFEINFLIILSEATKSMMTGRPIGLKISQNLNKNLTRGITNRKILNKILKDFERSDLKERNLIM